MWNDERFYWRNVFPFYRLIEKITENPMNSLCFDVQNRHTFRDWCTGCNLKIDYTWNVRVRQLIAVKTKHYVTFLFCETIFWFKELKFSSDNCCFAKIYSLKSTIIRIVYTISPRLCIFQTKYQWIINHFIYFNCFFLILKIFTSCNLDFIDSPKPTKWSSVETLNLCSKIQFKIRGT